MEFFVYDRIACMFYSIFFFDLIESVFFLLSLLLSIYVFIYFILFYFISFHWYRRASIESIEDDNNFSNPNYLKFHRDLKSTNSKTIPSIVDTLSENTAQSLHGNTLSEQSQSQDSVSSSQQNAPHSLHIQMGIDNPVYLTDYEMVQPHGSKSRV